MKMILNTLAFANRQKSLKVILSSFEATTSIYVSVSFLNIVGTKLKNPTSGFFGLLRAEHTLHLCLK